MNLTNRAEERVRTIIRIKEAATRRIATMERLLERAKEGIESTGDEATRKRIAIAEKEGLDILLPYKSGNLALPRIFEVVAAINRMRTLRIE